MLEYRGSASEGFTFYEHFIASNADDWFSNCCVESINNRLSGILVVKFSLFLGQIEVFEFDWPKGEWSGMSLSQGFSKLYWVFEIKLFLFCNCLNNWHWGLINLFRRSLILFALLPFCSFCFLCSSKQILLTFLSRCSNLCLSLSYSTFERSDFSVRLFMQSCKSFFDLRIAFSRNSFIPSLINPFCLLSWRLTSLFHNIFFENSSGKIDQFILWLVLLGTTCLTVDLFIIFSSFIPALRHFNFSYISVVN